MRADFVKEPQEWLYSSAIDYYISNGNGYGLDLSVLEGRLSNESAQVRDAPCARAAPYINKEKKYKYT